MGAGVVSLIGVDLLRDFRLHFLFDEDRVSVNEGSPMDAAHSSEPLMMDKRDHPYIQVQFGDGQANAVWDSGSSITIADLNFINRQSAFFAEAGHSTGTDATGAQAETAMFMMSSASIGGYLFPPHRVAGVDLSGANATLDMPMDLIIGYSTFSKANWWFDFPAKKWMISRWLGVQ
jgi:hypothetical protein